MTKQKHELLLDIGLILKSRTPNFKLTFPAGNEKVKQVPLASIQYIKADKEISVIHTNCDKYPEIMVAQKLGELEQSLQPYGFVRSHRSYMVNLSAVNPTSEMNNKLELHSGAQLPIARRKKKAVNNLLKRLDWL